MAMVLRPAANLIADRVRIIEPNETLAIGPVQGQRIVDAIRLLRRGRHPCDDEADPIAAFRIDHEHLTIQVQEEIETRIARFSHGIQL